MRGTVAKRLRKEVYHKGTSYRQRRDVATHTVIWLQPIKIKSGITGLQHEHRVAVVAQKVPDLPRLPNGKKAPAYAGDLRRTYQNAKRHHTG